MGPGAGFGVASFGGKELGEVEVGFGHGGGHSRRSEEGFGFFFLAGEGIGVGQESLSAVEIVVGLFGDDVFEVGDSGSGFAHEDGAGSALIEGVEGGRGHFITRTARVQRAPGRCAGDGSVESSAGLGETAVVHVEVAEFFEIADSGVDLDEGFELTDALAAGESAGGLAAEEVEVGSRFDEEVDDGAEGAEEDDDEEPVGIGAAAEEVDEGQGLEEESPPGEDEMNEKAHGLRTGYRLQGAGYRKSV